MTSIANYARSSVGAKHVMAVTGLLLIVFVVLHMVGHLQIFLGPNVYNAYAHFLQSLWEVKWPVRIALIAIVILHCVAAAFLVARNQSARGARYQHRQTFLSSATARAMGWTGLAILAFIAFHIAHFTLGVVQPEAFHHRDALGRYDAYGMYVAGFRNVVLYGVYFIGMALLSMHLGHGAFSWMQSLGITRAEKDQEKAGRIFAIVLFVGYMLPPTAVVLRLVG